MLLDSCRMNQIRFRPRLHWQVATSPADFLDVCREEVISSHSSLPPPPLLRYLEFWTLNSVVKVTLFRSKGSLWGKFQRESSCASGQSVGPHVGKLIQNLARLSITKHLKIHAPINFNFTFQPTAVRTDKVQSPSGEGLKQRWRDKPRNYLWFKHFIMPPPP